MAIPPINNRDQPIEWNEEWDALPEGPRIERAPDEDDFRRVANQALKGIAGISIGVAVTVSAEASKLSVEAESPLIAPIAEAAIEISASSAITVLQEEASSLIDRTLPINQK